jgi:hypothetical protein
MNKNRFKGITSFLDLLWILLAGFGAMFIIAFMLIQPPAKNADVIKKAEYIIVLEWQHEVTDDIDLWVMNPRGEIVSFRNKSSGFMNLEKDDLGSSNDTITDEYGNIITIELNREIITLRGVIAGEYQVMLHVFSRKYIVNEDIHGDEQAGSTTNSIREFTIEVIKINPYEVVYKRKGNYTYRGQEISLVRFTVNSDADFIMFNNLDSDFIRSSRSASTTNYISAGMYSVDGGPP